MVEVRSPCSGIKPPRIPRAKTLIMKSMKARIIAIGGLNEWSSCGFVYIKTDSGRLG